MQSIWSDSLLSYRARHLHLADKADIFHFVNLSDRDIPSVGDQVPNLGNSKFLNLCAESELVSKFIHRVLHEEGEPLVEAVVLTLHVRVAHRLTKNVFVEGARKVAFEQLIVVDGFRYKEEEVGVRMKCEIRIWRCVRTNDAPHELKVEQMVRVAVGKLIDHVSDTVAGRDGEEGVHRVEDFSGYDHIPLSQQSTRILTFLRWNICQKIKLIKFELTCKLQQPLQTASNYQKYATHIKIWC